MIALKTPEQLKAMREAGRITGEALNLAEEAVKPGISTKALDDIIRRHIERSGAKPSFLGLYGFPGSACISINEQVIHGIPSADVILREGDIVKIDTGAFFKGFHGDSARTIAVGSITAEAQHLIDVTRESFFAAFEQVKEGARIGDIGHAVQSYVEERGFSAVRDFVGHGVGRDLHEDPEVPNYGRPGRGVRLMTGMVIAIEPMINAGTEKVAQLSDGWTVVTADGALSAHYEHTVALTENGAEMLTWVK